MIPFYRFYKTVNMYIDLEVSKKNQNDQSLKFGKYSVNNGLYCKNFRVLIHPLDQYLMENCNSLFITDNEKFQHLK